MAVEKTEGTEVAVEEPKKKKRRGSKKRKPFPGDRPFTEVPTEWTLKHEALTASDFSTDVLFWQWEAHRAERRIKRFTAQKEEYLRNADHLEEHGFLPASDVKTANDMERAMDKNPGFEDRAKAKGINPELLRELLEEMKGE